MNKENVISDSAFYEIQSAIRKNENWIAYNSASHFLEKEDIFSFTNQGEASDFAASNISEHDSFKIIYAESAADVFRQIMYGNAPENKLFISAQQNTKNMNEQNFDYLKNQIKYNGFGEDLQRELREKMAEGKPDFNIIHHGKFGSDVTEAALQFKKSETNDMYYFNRYLLQLKNEKGDEAFTQSFRAGRDNNITLKEAYNMMNGRAVYKEMTPKEGEKYHAWLQLNFKETETNGDFKVKQMHDNYGYDLKATLAKYPIKEMENPDNALSLMRSLERGNRQLVTLMVDGKEQKLSIEASPQYKSLNMYDKDMNRLKGEQQSLLQKQAPGEKMIAGLAEKNVQQQGIGNGVVNKENGNNKKHREKKEMLNGEIMPKHNHSRKRSKGHSM